MEKVLEISLCDQEDFTDRYNKKQVSKDLIDYIVEEAIFLKADQTIKMMIHNECKLNCDIVEMIKDGLALEYQKSLRSCYLNNWKQFVLWVIGILFLFLYTLIEENFVFSEALLIIAWVPIWEAIDMELFTDVKERKKRKILKKLLNSEFLVC